MLNAIALWWVVGMAWFVVELTQGGGAKHLAAVTRQEASLLPFALLPLAAFIVVIIIAAAIVLMALVWPYWAWDDYRRGALFKPGRWDR